MRADDRYEKDGDGLYIEAHEGLGINRWLYFSEAQLDLILEGLNHVAITAASHGRDSKPADDMAESVVAEHERRTR